MNKLAVIAAGAAVFGVVATNALAADQLQEIIVHAGPLVTRSTVGRAPGTDAPVERVMVEHYVSYADLDLVKNAGVLALNKRVQAAARVGCQQLDKLYPTEPPNLQDCMRDAIRGASQQVQSAISAAQAGEAH